MKLHSSTDMGQTNRNQRKFKIRYQQSNSFSISNNSKGRFFQSSDTAPLRGFLLSQSDVYRQQRSEQHKQLQKIHQVPKTERPKRRPFKSPTNIGSVMDLVNSVNQRSQKNGTANSLGHQQKDFPKLPIQYNDQRVNGNAADNSKLKVIYRGYAPKNTYYFLKSLAFNQLHLRPLKTSRSEYQLQFQSKFQSGNLSAVARKSQRQFYIYMREDTNTFGLRQWYYYSVSNRKSGKYKFRIYKFSKFYSLYKQGMKPFVRNINQDLQWRQAGQNVKYQFDLDLKCYYLQFEYQFASDNMIVQFATQPPYTYAMLKNYLKLLIQKYRGIRIVKAGQSLSGLDIPRIQIVSNDLKSAKKKVVVIIARTHPGQTASNWALQSLIDRIFQRAQLRQYYDYYIIPMVNPDGVFLGNHRTGVMGQDINRNFNGNDLQYFPQVQVVQKLIQNLQKDRNKQIQFLLDLHGHSARRNIFAYGDEYPIGSNLFLLTHILPKILSQQLSTFKYNYCVFKVSKQKKNTARVYLSKKYKINAITFQQSYGLIDQGAIGVQHWKNFGIAIADSLKQFYQLFSKGGFQALQSYLSDDIQHLKNQNQKKLTKKNKLIEQIKTESNAKNQSTITQKFKTEAQAKNQMNLTAGIDQISQKSNDDSVNTQQLSSGDQELQNNQQGMELLKKQFLKLGCLKQGAKRQRYFVAERNLQIKNVFQPRLHEQKFSMASRILKFQMRKRQQVANFKINEEKNTRKKLNIIQKNERQSIQLPNLRKDR